MSNKETTADDKSQACHGTGTVAGARPVRTGPFLLNPALCRVCGGTGRKPRPKHSEE
jgi:DnaJ-class molecular chaperone